MGRYFLFLAILCLSACNEVDLDISKIKVSPLPDVDPTNTLVWNFPSPTLRAGESIPFGFTNGGVSFTTESSGIGTFDPSTLIYTVPINQAPASHSISIEDDTGKSGTNTIKIAGFQPGNKLQFPLTFGDQNHIKGSAVLDNGSIFTTSVVIDSPGWERWAVHRSTDEGFTWDLVDIYVPYEEGESHSMAMVNKGNDLYVCGYIWDWNSTNYNSEWIVKKSSDNGATWTIVDRYVEYDGADHVCTGIAVSPGKNLYAVGSNTTDRGVIRESIDDGATWTTIGKIATSEIAAVEISPVGVVWTVAHDGHLRKGTYALGAWNWVDVGPVTGVLSVAGYVQYGDLEIVSETEAYFSGNSGRWKILKTTDGGTSWNEVYTGAAMYYRGLDIKRLSTGELVAIGSEKGVGIGNSDTFKIIRSTDNGTTWNETYSNNSPSAEGVSLVETSNSLMAFGVFSKSPWQIINLRSLDAGATWAHRSFIHYKENLYSYINDFKVDRLGNLWATGDLEYIDDTFSIPWSVIKSSDNGLSWTNSDLFPGTTGDNWAQALAFGPSNEVYVAGYVDNNDTIKKSSDNGASWSVVDTNLGVETYKKFMASDSNGNLYMAGTSWVVPTSFLRKGTLNGTAWNTIVTFPIEPGHTNFTFLGLNVFNDDSIWIAARERNTTPADTTVIYRSGDGGTSFTEVFRTLEENWQSISIKKASNGDVYVNTLYKVIKTSDNGASWEDVYDGTLAGVDLKGFQFDNLGRLYVLNDNEQVLTQNQFDNSWFVMYDYSLNRMFSGSSLEQITDCGNMSQVCLIGRYDVSVTGSVIEMIPLVVP